MNRAITNTRGIGRFTRAAVGYGVGIAHALPPKFSTTEPSGDRSSFGNRFHNYHLNPLTKKAPARAPLSTLFFEALNACPKTYGRSLSECAKTLSVPDKRHSL